MEFQLANGLIAPDQTDYDNLEAHLRLGMMDAVKSGNGNGS